MAECKKLLRECLQIVQEQCLMLFLTLDELVEKFVPSWSAIWTQYPISDI